MAVVHIGSKSDTVIQKMVSWRIIAKLNAAGANVMTHLDAAKSQIRVYVQ
jgi:hypothetical protein